MPTPLFSQHGCNSPGTSGRDRPDITPHRHQGARPFARSMRADIINTPHSTEPKSSAPRLGPAAVHIHTERCTGAKASTRCAVPRQPSSPLCLLLPHATTAAAAHAHTPRPGRRPLSQGRNQKVSGRGPEHAMARDNAAAFHRDEARGGMS